MRKVSQNHDPHRYDDMLNNPHHVSVNHHPMPMQERAAQFMPFAALSGYEEMIEEAARTTEEPVFLSEEALEELNEKMQILIQNISSHPEVQFTLFQNDERKEGGRIFEKTGQVRKIDRDHDRILLMDKTLIDMHEIIEMKGTVFDKTAENTQ